ncbi:MAG: UbiX family flavin prenyltransferase [bacterium]|nr:UbiX family flavin prenyltransferase [bacterium]
MMYIVAITGASGAIIGIRLIEELLERGNNVDVIVSPAAWKTIHFEVFGNEERFVTMREVLDSRDDMFNYDLLKEYASDDLFSAPASGTTRYKGMIVAPCSMKTLSAIAHGYADSLITRAADVSLKEGRKTILIPREAPLNLIHLENMVQAKKAGAHILPPAPAFYTFPETIGDVVDFVTGKILNLLGIEHQLFREWGKRND